MTDIVSTFGANSGNAEMEALWNNPEQFGAAIIDEGQLEKEKVRLLGVPFVITRVIYQSDFKKSDRGYVTLEIVIAPYAQLKEAEDRGWIPPANLPLLYKPGETVKFNDGSTGVRRQITSMLAQAGMLNVGSPMSDDPKVSVYDKPWTEWDSFSQTSQQSGTNGEKIDVPDFTFGPSGMPLRIIVTHGLRVSHLDDWDTDVYYFS